MNQTAPNALASPEETRIISELLTTTEAAAKLGVSKRTVQDLTAERRLGFIKFGRNVRFAVADLDKFIESHRVRPVGWKGGKA